MSVNVYDVTVELGMVENMGVAVGISLITCPEKYNYARLFENGRFSSYFFSFPV